ncbi:golgin subfamily A member 6-like protein 25 [Macrobrachium rosenbergii]|uniref:golgin subfamily A member 6-like protein 25 n=1 Tax=Macrobrachium rosenbergii TaxID=79674 RepID=UPI0034D60E84
MAINMKLVKNMFCAVTSIAMALFFAGFLLQSDGSPNANALSAGLVAHALGEIVFCYKNVKAKTQWDLTQHLAEEKDRLEEQAEMLSGNLEMEEETGKENAAVTKEEDVHVNVETEKSPLQLENRLLKDKLLKEKKINSYLRQELCCCHMELRSAEDLAFRQREKIHDLQENCELMRQCEMSDQKHLEETKEIVLTLRRKFMDKELQEDEWKTMLAAADARARADKEEMCYLEGKIEEHENREIEEVHVRLKMEEKIRHLARENSILHDRADRCESLQTKIYEADRQISILNEEVNSQQMKLSAAKEYTAYLEEELENKRKVISNLLTVQMQELEDVQSYQKKSKAITKEIVIGAMTRLTNKVQQKDLQLASLQKRINEDKVQHAKLIDNVQKEKMLVESTLGEEIKKLKKEKSELIDSLERLKEKNEKKSWSTCGTEGEILKREDQDTEQVREDNGTEETGKLLKEIAESEKREESLEEHKNETENLVSHAERMGGKTGTKRNTETCSWMDSLKLEDENGVTDIIDKIAGRYWILKEKLKEDEEYVENFEKEWNRKKNRAELKSEKLSGRSGEHPIHTTPDAGSCK